jgi:6-pyruvoyl-tetrahydropterin synthase
MNTEKFTQGEWRAEITSHEFCDTGDYVTDFGIVTDKNIGIAQCFDNMVINEDEAEANCYLIAAAPEMYDRLKRTGSDLLTILNPNISQQAKERLVEIIIENIESVLKKARGEE